MALTLNGSGTITGLSAGGLPDATITQAEIGTNVAGTGPAFSAYASAGTSMTNGVITKILFQTEDFDTNSNYDTSTSRFTPTVAGYYYISATTQAPTSGAAYYVTLIYKNGSVYMQSPQSAGNGIYINSANALIYFNGSTDYVEIYSAQYTGGTVTSTAVNYVKFAGCLVRGA